MTLTELRDNWQDVPAFHQSIHEYFTALVNSDPQLNEHRTWVEQNVWGFGERSFHWLWKILLEGLPEKPVILELGCFRGQTLSLFCLLRQDANIFGITPLSTEGGMWESDYDADIKKIHNHFNLQHPLIIKGLSEDPKIIEYARGEYDLVYIDGGHERRHIDNDMTHYAPMVVGGGYLVIDDACTDFHMPWGYFQGIVPVTEGVLEYMEKNEADWEFIANVVHLRIYRRK
jgi:hypothetical protein